MEKCLQNINQTIQNRNAKAIVLQVPPQLIPFAQQLSQKIVVRCYINSDHMRSSCCLDKVGAAHVDHDLVFHLGVTCFNLQSPNFIYYLNQKQALDQHQLINRLNQLENGLVLFDQQLYHYRSAYHNDRIAALQLFSDRQPDSSYFAYGYYNAPNSTSKESLTIVSDDELFFQMFLTGRFLTPFKKINFWNSKGESLEVQNRILAKRLFLIQKGREANKIGIIVSGMLECSNRIANDLKRILVSKGKKSYTFLMNNISQTKLGNFPQIDCFVLVSCHLTCLKTQKEFYRSVLTPYDMLVALELEPFELYHWDIRLLDLDKHLETSISQKSCELVRVNDQMVLSRQLGTLQAFRQRQWQGLSLQSREPSKLEQGKTGLAREYKNE